MTSGLEGKGGRNIRLHLYLSIPHRADEREAFRFQMLPNEPIKSGAVLIQHQHMQDRHRIDEIKFALQPVMQAIHNGKALGISGQLFPAIADTLRGDIGCQQIPAFLKQRRGIASLTTSNLQNLRLLGNLILLYRPLDNGGWDIRGPLKPLTMHLLISQLIRMIILLLLLHLRFLLLNVFTTSL